MRSLRLRRLKLWAQSPTVNQEQNWGHSLTHPLIMCPSRWPGCGPLALRAALPLPLVLRQVWESGPAWDSHGCQKASPRRARGRGSRPRHRNRSGFMSWDSELGLRLLPTHQPVLPQQLLWPPPSPRPPPSSKPPAPRADSHKSVQLPSSSHTLSYSPFSTRRPEAAFKNRNHIMILSCLQPLNGSRLTQNKSRVPCLGCKSFHNLARGPLPARPVTALPSMTGLPPHPPASRAFSPRLFPASSTSRPPPRPLPAYSLPSGLGFLSWHPTWGLIPRCPVLHSSTFLSQRDSQAVTEIYLFP
nr:uncharacterized protein LOC111775949 [Equus caballus]XP_023509935.1 uncharacterized protein LOC111775949 [Equus caballus]XP_023509936.1 uncharacterized protein LOC111775949 [Equus caballus]